jgi:2,4-dichlorophenol 6-monooxygenase
MREISVQVLVIGTGPAGLAASALLAKYGIETLAVSRHSGVANSPRAHITNQRTLEVYRDLGIEGAVREQATPNALMGNSVWAVSFAGRELARMRVWGSGAERQAEYAAASPCEMCDIPQHILDPIVLGVARAHGARFRFNTELQRIEEADGTVLALLADCSTGEQISVRARYAIGADGADSLVGRQIGITPEGSMDLFTVASCWFEADLEPYCAYRPGTLYWMTQPDEKQGIAFAAFTCARQWNEWVMSFGCPPDAGEDLLGEEAMIARARKLIGVPDIAVKVKTVGKWRVNSAVVPVMGKGRIFLAGDAAHCHSPHNGLGSNTSVQDSFNLAWKLALVLKGQAGRGLLDTYSAERRPVARQVVDRAAKSMMEAQQVFNAFGCDTATSSADFQVSLDELFGDSEAGRVRRSALEAALALQHYQFNCHGVEMGQRYASAAIAADTQPIDAQAIPVEEERDAELYYRPSTVPGSSLPHAWLERERNAISSIDLAGHGRFTLLTGVGGTAWKQAARHVRETLGIEIEAIAIGPGCEVLDPYSNWAARRGVLESGCLLVRPDRHVMWRAQTVSANASQVLLDVMRSVLWSSALAVQESQAGGEAIAA